MSWDELIAYNRRWVQLHEGNNHQAEAARRMTVLLDAMEALRSGDVIERAARALYAEDVNESMDTPWPDYDSPKNVGRPLYEERARNALLAAIGDNDE